MHFNGQNGVAIKMAAATLFTVLEAQLVFGI
jgi:hypothetical protein